MKTNKELLYKGIKHLASSLPLIFLGPSIVYSSFNNQDHPLYVYILVIGLIMMIGAILLISVGLKVLIKAFFN